MNDDMFDQISKFVDGALWRDVTGEAHKQINCHGKFWDQMERYLQFDVSGQTRYGSYSIVRNMVRDELQYGEPEWRLNR